MSLPPPATSLPSPSATSSHGGSGDPDFASLGLGYPIAVALAFLVLLSVLLLASYLCCRAHRPRRNPNAVRRHVSDGVILPRIIFVAEDDADDGAAVGLDASVIASYPKFVFERESVKESTCSICLCEYRASEMLRMMPECRHSFHLCCLDAWLRLNGSCPVCRNSPLPTPLSTPLQEVVPLAQFAADRHRRR